MNLISASAIDVWIAFHDVWMAFHVEWSRGAVEMNSIPACGLLVALLFAASADAQWPERTTGAIPRTRDGKVNLAARAPRTAHGTPDLFGVWQPDPGHDAATGFAGILLSRYFLDITAGINPEEGLFQPWAATLYKQRQPKDDPTTRCQPVSVPALDAYPSPFKIIQTPKLIIVLHESNVNFRQIFLDGRRQPRDAQPTWMGYSVGKWEADTLVVDSIGFNDQSWLDRRGHPHSESMRVTERFRRLDFGHLEISVTIDDPKTYTRPLTFIQPQMLLPDAELMEYVCTENEKDVSHFR